MPDWPFLIALCRVWLIPVSLEELLFQMLFQRGIRRIDPKLTKECIANSFWTFILMGEPKLELKMLQENEFSYELLRDAGNMCRSTQMTLTKMNDVSQCRTAEETARKKTVVSEYRFLEDSDSALWFLTVTGTRHLMSKLLACSEAFHNLDARNRSAKPTGCLQNWQLYHDGLFRRKIVRDWSWSWLRQLPLPRLATVNITLRVPRTSPPQPSPVSRQTFVQQRNRMFSGGRWILAGICTTFNRKPVF